MTERDQASNKPDSGEVGGGNGGRRLYAIAAIVSVTVFIILAALLAGAASAWLQYMAGVQPAGSIAR